MAFVKLNNDSEIFYSFANKSQALFPVGYIYLSTDPTNPGTYFGGSWSLITDRFLVGAGNAYGVTSTGGGSVTLSTANLPSHSHYYVPSGSISGGSYGFSGNNCSGVVDALYRESEGFGGSGPFYNTGGIQKSTNKQWEHGNNGLGFSMTPTGSVYVASNPSFSGSAAYTAAEGSGQAFSVVPSYYAVYMWRRYA